VHAEPRLGREIVDAVHAREKAVLLARGVAQPAQHVEDGGRIDDEARLVVLVVGAEHGSRAGVSDLLRDQLESWGVGHPNGS
jgi:hypothetical protein